MTYAAAAAVLNVFGIFVACLVVAWPAYRVFTLWLERALSGGEALVALFVLLVFLGGLMRTWGQPVSIVLWLFLLAAAVTIAVGGRMGRRRKLQAFFREDVEAAMRALTRDPSNAAAHMRLGQLYEQQGDLDLAVQHYEQVARLVPRDSEARLALANAVERRRRATTGNLMCWRCGRENAGHAARCAGCGALISDRNQIVQSLSSPGAVKALLALTVVSSLGAILGSLLRSVPLGLTIMSYGLLFAAVLCYVYPRWVQHTS